MWHKFPSVYWFKALMLPTILYRLTQLLLSEDLLIKINSKCNIEINKSNGKLFKLIYYCKYISIICYF